MKNNKFKNSTLVCVTDQKRCEELITAGKRISDKYDTDLYVINVNNFYQYGKKQDPEALEYLYNISKDNGAMMSVIYDEEFLDVMEKSIKKYTGIHVITGMPESENSILTELWKRIDTVDYYMVDSSGKTVKVGSAIDYKVKSKN